MLIQLPGGRWINPAEVSSIWTESVPYTSAHINRPDGVCHYVTVRFLGGDQFMAELPTEEEAVRDADRIAALVNQATKPGHLSS